MRRLAAIMFTDMVGYTKQMQLDEKAAKAKRDRHRTELEKSISLHQGRIIQYYGDGSLSIFDSALKGVECAIELQQKLQNKPKIPIRIGIHVGEIAFADDGIYGDAVNVASRVENLSVPGGILISGKVYDEIRNHPEFVTESLGMFELKNVNLPVQIYAIKIEGLLTPATNSLMHNPQNLKKSLAVLPFVNMSSDIENEYFSDGITEELLNALTRVDGIQVIARTSSFAFKGKNEDIRKIGKQLNVTYVLEGSVRKVGNRVRITSQLINAVDGYHIWSDTYDRTLEDIFEVQDEISRKISTTLREKLTEVEAQQNIVKPPTKNLDAYNLYLKGRFYYNKWSPPAAHQAIKYYEEAIDMEVDFALPYVGLSECYCLLGSMGQMPSGIAFPRANESAGKALSIDNTLSDAHSSMSWVRFFYELDWTGAEESYRHAVLLNPDSAGAHQGHSVFLLAQEKYKESLLDIKKSIKLDPLSLPINFTFAYVYYCSGRYEEALSQHDKTLEIDPTFRGSLEGKGYCYSRMGQWDKAMEIFKELYEQTEDPLKGVTALGYAYAKTGDNINAEKCLDKLLERNERDKDVSLFMDFATIYSGLKDYDKVFEYFGKAIKARVGILYMFADPEWKEIRSNPRFEKIKEAIH